jgi:hypothetical protein
MRIELTKSACIVTREQGDPKYYGDFNAKGESNLLYAIKNKLNSIGFDLIKKRMWKDGHMVSEMQQYIRTRKPTGDPDKDIMIYNTFWQIRGANDDFNKGQVVLGLKSDCFNLYGRE